MKADHDWHLFDSEQGLEVRRECGEIQVRVVGGTESVPLTEEEWNQVREPGPDPEILERLRQ